MSEMKAIKIKAGRIMHAEKDYEVLCESCGNTTRHAAQKEATRWMKMHLDVEHDVDVDRLSRNDEADLIEDETGATVDATVAWVYKNFGKGWAAGCTLCRCFWYFKTQDAALDAMKEHLQCTHGLNIPHLEGKGCLRVSDPFEKPC